ncbi:hypothetical protein [Butyrivibrio proteoclasticus]|uniref:hypothetical protein n=1 Tax=Butyrivibrio proteoclasticus TaxID=43305 RepID=UPI00047A27FD|nr:hypothetical protein [Butyrivibrio proteoclasticus]
MKKNNLVNKNIISALLIGISASMAFAQPITAFAEEPEGDNNENTNEATTNTAEPSVTDAAASQAEESHEAIEEAITTTEQAAEVINGDTPMSAEDTGNVAQEAVEEAVNETENLYSTEKLEEADADVQEVKEELAQAAAEDKKANEEAKEVVDTVEYAQEIADLAEDTVKDAKTLSDEITEEITNASSYEEATEAYERLKNLVETTTEDVEAKRTILDQLTEEYNRAVDALTTADANYETHVDNAADKAEDAKEILDTMTDDFAAADEAIAEAAEKVETEKQAADKITEQRSKTTANWDRQAEYVKTILTYYYIPQVVEQTEIPPENIKITRTKGFDTQDYNYYKVEYKDAEGNKKVLYFNYDRVDKIKSNNRYTNLGSSADIIIYEKTAEEIGADNYLRQYYKDEDFYKYGVLKNQSDYRAILISKANAGDFRVYAYYVGGEVHYLVQEEVDQLLIDETITYENGKYYVDGHEMNEVVQNQNSKAYGDPENVTYFDTTTNEDYLNFMNNAAENAEKFEAYEEKSYAAKEAISNAKTEVDALNGALDELKGSRTNRISTLPNEKILDLVVAYGISIDEYNSMSLGQAVALMNNLLKEAQDKLANAETVLAGINSNFLEMTQVVDDMAPKATPAEANQPGNAGGQSTASDNAGTTIEDTAVPTTATAQATNAQATNDAATFDQQADEIIGVLLQDNGTVAGVKRDGDGAEEAIYAPVFSDNLIDIPADLGNPEALKDKNIVQIVDEEVAKSDTIGGETKEDAVSWWWLLAIAILGATGEKMYREYKEKEEEKEKEKIKS